MSPWLWGMETDDRWPSDTPASSGTWRVKNLRLRFGMWACLAEVMDIPVPSRSERSRKPAMRYRNRSRVELRPGIRLETVYELVRSKEPDRHGRSCRLHAGWPMNGQAVLCLARARVCRRGKNLLTLP